MTGRASLIGGKRAGSASVGRAGYFIEFLDPKELEQFDEELAGGALAVQRTAGEAAFETGARMKQLVRSHLSSVFPPKPGSRRNAIDSMVQSKTFDTVDGQPGAAYVLFSKLGRGKGPGGFVDYLKAHVEGRSDQAPSYFRIAVSPEAKALKRRGGRFETGYFPASGTTIFLRKAKDDPSQLLLLRKQSRTGKTDLLEVMLKSISIKPKLGGLKAIFAQAEQIFEQQADAAWRRNSSSSSPKS